MHQLNEALDREIHELDTVLLRLTTIRLLLAAGKHHMVPRGLEDLDVSVASFDQAQVHADEILRSKGHSSVDEAAAGLEIEEQARLSQRVAAIRTLHRDVRVALASTGAAAERSMRNAIEHVPELQPVAETSDRHHGFIIGT